MAATPTTVTVKVKADLSAFRHATVDEVAAVLAEHVYGDGGPVAGGDGPLSVCTRAATDLCHRFQIIPA